MSKYKVIYRKQKHKFYYLINSYLKKVINNEKVLNSIRKKKNFILPFISFYSNVIYLKIFNIKYFNLPSNHIYSFMILKKFLKFFKKKEINFFLIAVTLLGSVRQNSFAGRPADIDLGILDAEYQKLKIYLPLLIKNGVKNINVKHQEKKKEYYSNLTKFKIDRIQFNFLNRLIDVSIFKKVKIDNKIMWLGEVEKNYGNDHNGILLEYDDLKKLKLGKLYGKNFLIPNNSHEYLKKKYGKNWRVPDKKQFVWKIQN